MSNRIEYAPQALRELDAIWDYIRYDLANPSAADRIVNGILDQIDRLEQFPESGAPLMFDGGIDSGYRYVVFDKYVAFYRVQTEERGQQNAFDTVIYVEHVIYSGRDYMRLLFPDI